MCIKHFRQSCIVAAFTEGVLLRNSQNTARKEIGQCAVLDSIASQVTLQLPFTSIERAWYSFQDHVGRGY